jgi:hypothetical protein
VLKPSKASPEVMRKRDTFISNDSKTIFNSSTLKGILEDNIGNIEFGDNGDGGGGGKGGD